MNVSVYLCLITAKARWECLCACLRHVRPNCFRRRHVRMNNLKALTPFFLRLLPPSSTPGWRRRRASTTWSKPTWGTRSCWRMLCRTSRLKGSPTTQKALSLLLGSSLRWDKKVFSFGERKNVSFFFSILRVKEAQSKFWMNVAFDGSMFPLAAAAAAAELCLSLPSAGQRYYLVSTVQTVTDEWLHWNEKHHPPAGLLCSNA